MKNSTEDYVKKLEMYVKDPENDVESIKSACNKTGINLKEATKLTRRLCESLSRYGDPELANFLSKYAGQILEAGGKEVLKIVSEYSEVLSYIDKNLAIENIVFAPLVVKMYKKEGRDPLVELEKRQKRLVKGSKPVLGYGTGPGCMLRG